MSKVDEEYLEDLLEQLEPEKRELEYRKAYTRYLKLRRGGDSQARRESAVELRRLERALGLTQKEVDAFEAQTEISQGITQALEQMHAARRRRN